MENQLSGKELVRWKYQRYLKDYLRCVKSVDDCVGELWNWLDEKNMLDNTIFVYSSDQGFYLGEHGWFDKRFMYDESYRTPLVMSWPKVISPGSVNSNLVSNLDFAQTFLDAAGIEAHPRMQGESLLPLLHGDTNADWRKAIIIIIMNTQGGIWSTGTKECMTEDLSLCIFTILTSGNYMIV